MSSPNNRIFCNVRVNVLDCLPKSLQGKAKSERMAETRDDAHAAFERFMRTYQAKYPKAVDKLLRDRETLLAFYDFPAEHWRHIRSTNPIESTFATIRHRSTRTKNCVCRATLLGLVYRLAREAEKSWQRIHGSERIADLDAGVLIQGWRTKATLSSSSPPEMTHTPPRDRRWRTRDLRSHVDVESG